VPKRRALILDADYAAGIESAQSLGRAGVEVHAACPASDALILHSRRCAHGHIQPEHPDAILPWVDTLDQRFNFDLIVPSTERSLMAFANSSGYEDLYSKAVLPPRESLQLAIDKDRVWQLAQSLAVPVPPSVTARADSIPPLPFGFPVAVKPVRSKQIQGDNLLDLRVSYAHTAEEMRDTLSALPAFSFQVQSLVRGVGVGIELLFDRGRVVRYFAHRRVHELPLTGGGSSYRVSITPPQQLLAHSIALLEALRWHGVAMVEWKVDSEGKAYLIEINARLWGSLGLAIDAGVDFPRDLLALATGDPLPPQTMYRVGYYTRNLTRDLDWQIANLRADRSNPQLLVRPRLRSALEFLRPLLFAESWDHFDFGDLGITFRLIRSFVAKKFSAATAKIRWRIHSRNFVRKEHPRILAQIRDSTKEGKNILFVCRGNICRSPLAEYLLSRKLPTCVVSSAGFYPKSGRLSPANMQRAARLVGVDLGSHRSRQLTAELIDQADLVLIMDRHNLREILNRFPSAKSKMTFLGLFASTPAIEIQDPYSLPVEKATAICRIIEDAAANLSALLQADVKHRSEETARSSETFTETQ
jgi:protein-tyrosine-phosphatase